MASESLLVTNQDGGIDMTLKQKIEQARANRPSLTPKIPMDPPVKLSTEERLELLEDALLESLVNENGS